MSAPKRPFAVTDVFITALAPVIWGSTFSVTTEFLPPDRPFTAALLRALPAGVLLLLLSRRLPSRGQLLSLTVLAVLNIGLFQGLLFVAAYRLPGGVAAVVGAVQPLVVMGLAWVLDWRRPRQLAIWAALLGVVGMAALLLSPQSSWDLIGIAAAMGGAISMAAGTFLARRWRNDLPVLAFTGWQLVVGGLLLLPVAWWLDEPLPQLSRSQILGYAYLSVAGALLAYVLWFRGLSRLSPVAVSSLSLLSPLVAVAIGWVWLGQSIAGGALVGAVMVLLSIAGVQRACNVKPQSSKATWGQS